MERRLQALACTYEEFMACLLQPLHLARTPTEPACIIERPQPAPSPRGGACLHAVGSMLTAVLGGHADIISVASASVYI